MADRISKDARSRNMRQITSGNTRPEMRLRRLVYALGYRYRLHVRSLPGCPDLVFHSRKKVLFLHGCFWHRHQGCRYAHLPESNTSYWIPKLRRNAARDAENAQALATAGWAVLTVWECEMRDESAIAARLRAFLGSRSS